VSGLKIKPFSPTSTDCVVLEAEPLSVELAVVVGVSLESFPPPPYWAPTRGRHNRAKVHKDTLIIIATKLDEKTSRAKICVETQELNSKGSGDGSGLLYVILSTVYVKYRNNPMV